MNTTKHFLSLTLLISVVFFSALGIIYIQAKNRLLVGSLQSVLQNRDKLYLQWGQLLLEQSAWSTQARIQLVASEELDMQLPQQNAIEMIQISEG